MSDNTFTLIVLAMALLTFISIVYIMTKDYRNESVGTTWQGAIDELINEQKLKAPKDRVAKNKTYYFIHMEITKETEDMMPLDDMNYMEGNYFHNFDETYGVMQNFIKQLKNR